MEDLYFDYDKINMILTVKSFKSDNISTSKIVFDEILIKTINVSDGIQENKIIDIYGFVIRDDENLENVNYDLKNIIFDLILTKDDYSREIIKKELPNFYCVLFNNIDQEMRDAIFINKSS